MNMYQAIGNALDIALESDPTAGLYLVFHLHYCGVWFKKLREDEIDDC